MILLNAEAKWRGFFILSSMGNAKIPLSLKTKTLIELSVTENDKINIEGVIHDVDAFLKMSTKEKENLITEILFTVFWDLAANIHKHTTKAWPTSPNDTVADSLSKLAFPPGTVLSSKEDIQVILKIIPIYAQDPEMILDRIELPFNLGKGLACYTNGTVYCNQKFYLELKADKNYIKTQSKDIFTRKIICK